MYRYRRGTASHSSSGPEPAAPQTQACGSLVTGRVTPAAENSWPASLLNREDLPLPVPPARAATVWPADSRSRSPARSTRSLASVSRSSLKPPSAARADAIWMRRASAVSRTESPAPGSPGRDTSAGVSPAQGGPAAGRPAAGGSQGGPAAGGSQGGPAAGDPAAGGSQGGPALGGPPADGPAVACGLVVADPVVADPVVAGLAVAGAAADLAGTGAIRGKTAPPGGAAGLEAGAAALADPAHGHPAVRGVPVAGVGPSGDGPSGDGPRGGDSPAQGGAALGCTTLSGVDRNGAARGGRVLGGSDRAASAHGGPGWSGAPSGSCPASSGPLTTSGPALACSGSRDLAPKICHGGRAAVIVPPRARRRPHATGWLRYRPARPRR